MTEGQSNGSQPRRFDPLQAAAEVIREAEDHDDSSRAAAPSHDDAVAPAPAQTTGRVPDVADNETDGDLRGMSPRERRAAAKAARMKAAELRRRDRAAARSRSGHAPEVDDEDAGSNEMSLAEKLAEARRSATSAADPDAVPDSGDIADAMDETKEFKPFGAGDDLPAPEVVDVATPAA